MTRLAVAKVSWSLKRMSMVLSLRVMPLCRAFFSRNAKRISPVNASTFFVKAAGMSTCNMKCTPPRKSKPKYIGAAPKLVNHLGDSVTWFNATT